MHISWLLLGTATQVLAQDEAAPEATADLTLPPVIEGSPGEAHFEPPPEDREGLEVEVTGGDSEWRIPDLGTSMRDDEDERDPDQRIEVSFLPLYDPEKQEEVVLEPVPVVDVMRDLGFIRIFEIQIGRKAGD